MLIFRFRRRPLALTATATARRRPSLAGAGQQPARAIGLLLALAAGLLLGAPSAQAAWTKLQFTPPPAALDQPAELTPIAPGDPAWNPPPFAGIGDPRGNTIAREGEPQASTTDYVEFARTLPQGRDEFGPLRGDLLVDFERVQPGLPAIFVIHGGLVAGDICSGQRRATQHLWANQFTALGYIVFMPDLKRPTNDRNKGVFGQILNPKGRGDCMADDGWEPGATRAQVSLQLGVRALKTILGKYAAAHPSDARVASAFEQASRKVVAFGGSSGGHFAARLALRSEDGSGAPGDGPEHRLERRVAGAVAIGSIGECTPSNPVRNFSKFYGLFAFPWPVIQPWKHCGPEQPDAEDSPIKFYMGSAHIHDRLRGPRTSARSWRRWDSPLSGAPGWGRNLGWDSVVDGRWAARTCDDMPPEVSCTTKILPVSDGVVHPIFPYFSRSPGHPQTAPTHWEAVVRDEVDAFFRSVKADDAR